MNTLTIETAKTETTPGEFVTDGFKVTVNAENHALNGKTVYVSRFANKAMTKAFVLLGTEFQGFAITVADPEVCEVAGKLNLEQRLDADRFRHIRQVALAEMDTDTVVEAMKASDGAAIQAVVAEQDSSETDSE